MAKTDELKEKAAELAKDRAAKRRALAEEVSNQEPPSVSAGPIDKVIDLAFNPSRDKIREVTSIDRIQGRLLPQLDIIDMMWQYIVEISAFRQDADVYATTYKRKRPLQPNLIEEFTYRTAQWQKSIQGMNLKSAIDLALAETETRSNREEDMFSGHEFDD